MGGRRYTQPVCEPGRRRAALVSHPAVRTLHAHAAKAEVLYRFDRSVVVAKFRGPVSDETKACETIITV